MDKFIVGESVTINTVTKKLSAGVLVEYDPTTVKVNVYDPDGASIWYSVGPPIDLGWKSMSRTATGTYTYNVATTGLAVGQYRIRNEVADGTKITYEDFAFELEA